MKLFIAIDGSGATYRYIAERVEIDPTGKFFLFYDDQNKTVGVRSTYGVRSISDQPWNDPHDRFNS